jgi:hypothetical protein
MPSSAQILDGLTNITNEWRILAAIWHGYFALLGVGLGIGWRPSKRFAGMLLGLPLLSVSALAWASSNPFNGVAFALGAAVLVASSVRLSGRVNIGRTWLICLGATFFAFGWIYPHFLATESSLAYLYAAPTGLIPCPTLSVVIGLALMVNGLNSRAWSLLLAIMGLSYGIFGGVVLEVGIDWILAVAALTILLIGIFGLTDTEQVATSRLTANE